MYPLRVNPELRLSRKTVPAVEVYDVTFGNGRADYSSGAIFPGAS